VTKESNAPTISLVENALGRPNPQSGNALKRLEIKDAQLLDSRTRVFDSSILRPQVNTLEH
jgi:hypothetical protein